MKDRFYEDLNAYADGQLSRERSEEMARHLEECEDCQKDYEEILAVKAAMALAAPKAAIPQEAGKTWRSALSADGAVRRKNSRRGMAVKGASALVAACLCLLCASAIRFAPAAPDVPPVDAPLSENEAASKTPYLEAVGDQKLKNEKLELDRESTRLEDYLMDDAILLPVLTLTEEEAEEFCRLFALKTAENESAILAKVDAERTGELYRWLSINGCPMVRVWGDVVILRIQ